MLKAPCGKCHGDTFHDTLYAVESTASYPGFKTAITSLVQCRGCGSVSTEVRRTREDSSEFTEYLPPPLMHHKPGWLSQLPPNTQDAMEEVYHALQYRQRRLFLLGIRTVVDLVILQTVGDRPTFPEKLDALVDAGYIGVGQRETLLTTIDAGSATSHRGFSPPDPVLDYALLVIEGILNQVHIVQPMTKTIQALIPPRPGLS